MKNYSTNLTLKDKSVDDVLRTWIMASRLVGANKSTDLWWQPVWPDWAIYWTLSNFLKPLSLINLPKSANSWVSKYIIFLVKSFLGNLYRHLAIFFWSHWLEVRTNQGKDQDDNHLVLRDDSAIVENGSTRVHFERVVGEWKLWRQRLNLVTYDDCGTTSVPLETFPQTTFDQWQRKWKGCSREYSISF